MKVSFDSTRVPSTDVLGVLVLARQTVSRYARLGYRRHDSKEESCLPLPTALCFRVVRLLSMR